MKYSKKEWEEHIGEVVVILKKPDRWDSSGAPLYPMQLDFPWKGTLLEVKSRNNGAANIDGYGFSIDETYINFNIESYEIY